MCGIVGFVNTDPLIKKPRADWLEQALYVDQLRGIHSTGLVIQDKAISDTAAVDPGKLPALRVYKRALAASDFLQLSTVRNMA